MVNKVKEKINQKLKETRMMVLSSNYWNFREDFEQIKAATGVMVSIHCNEGYPLQFSQSAKKYETYWKQQDQELWRSYTSNFNPVKKAEEGKKLHDNQKLGEEVRVLGSKECLLIGLEDQVEKFSQELQKLLGQQPVKKYPFLKYQSTVSQKIQENKHCIIEPLEGGGISIKGRDHHAAFLDYASLLSETKEMPPYWDENHDDCLIEVSKKSSEFKEIRNLFTKGLQASKGNYEVIKLQRVQSRHLWDQYSRQKFLLSCHQFYREIEVYQTEDGLFSLLHFSGIDNPDTPRNVIDSRVFASNPRIYDLKLKAQTRVQILFKAIIGQVHEESSCNKGSIVPPSPEIETMMTTSKKGKKFRLFVQSRTYPAYRISYRVKVE